MQEELKIPEDDIFFISAATGEGYSSAFETLLKKLYQRVSLDLA